MQLRPSAEGCFFDKICSEFNAEFESEIRYDQKKFKNCSKVKIKLFWLQNDQNNKLATK
jgi:hypothetical protein